MVDPTTQQVKILADHGAIKSATLVAILGQVRQWPWGRIAASIAALAGPMKYYWLS